MNRGGADKTYGNGLATYQLPAVDGTANQVLQTNGSGVTSWVTPSGSGTVTSVALSLPSIITVTGSPVTTAGTLTGTLATQTANTLWAGPTSGGAATPTFRAHVYADLSPVVGTTASTLAAGDDNRFLTKFEQQTNIVQMAPAELLTSLTMGATTSAYFIYLGRCAAAATTVALALFQSAAGTSATVEFAIYTGAAPGRALQGLTFVASAAAANITGANAVTRVALAQALTAGTHIWIGARFVYTVAPTIRATVADWSEGRTMIGTFASTLAATGNVTTGMLTALSDTLQGPAIRAEFV